MNKKYFIVLSQVELQSRFAIEAYKNLGAKSDFKVFSSVHSFLSHCAVISKIIANDDLNVNLDSLGLDLVHIHERRLRNHLDHIDERLAEHSFNEPTILNDIAEVEKQREHFTEYFILHNWDPITMTYTFMDEDFDLNHLYKELVVLNNKLREKLEMPSK